jgi:hypothetical protein
VKLVLVEWEDASIVDDSAWVDRDTQKKPEPRVFKQVGWLVDMAPDAVILTSAYDHISMATRERIPMGMVRSVVEFNPAKGAPLKLPRRSTRA